MSSNFIQLAYSREGILDMGLDELSCIDAGGAERQYSLQSDDNKNRIFAEDPPMTLLAKRLWLIIFLSAFCNSIGLASTRRANSCSLSDVQTAINAAADGDTVAIPNGTCTWTGGITTSKQIKILGDTKGGVVITHSAGSASLLDLTTGNSFSTEVGNIKFQVSGGSGAYMDISGSDTAKPPLIHDNYFSVPNFTLAECIHFTRNGGVI